MNKGNKVRGSLVIPAYNEAAQLRACLDAATHQSVPFYEIIVVDNNSTDETAAIARSYPEVTLLSETEQGLRPARNKGLDAASGDVIGRIDADTIINKDWCERLVQQFGDTSVVAVTGPCYYHDMPAKQANLAIDRFCRQMLFGVSRPMFYGSNMALRRSVWEAIRGDICTRGEFFEDCDLTIHARLHGFSILFDKKLIVGVSARRLDDNPRQFYRNMSQYGHTFAMHGQRSNSAQAARLLYLSAYATLKPLRIVYNPDAGSVSLRRLRRKSVARPTSNT